MSILNDQTHIQNIDKSNMAKLIIDMPTHIYKGYFEAKIHKPPVFHGATTIINQIVIAGMGGSAISADIVKVLFDEKIPITVVKDFKLPYIDESSLVIVTSYSGNTEETIECLKTAKGITKNVAAITAGGKIKEQLDENKLWIQLPTGYPPRTAIGYIFFSIIKILEIYKIIPDQKENVQFIIEDMIAKAKSISPENETETNIAKNSAEQIYPKIPIIYSSNPTLAPIAYRWKCQINENAKYHAFTHQIPEMLHNEIEGWETKTDTFIPIFLRLYDEQPKYLKGLKAFQTLLRQQNIPYLEFYTDTYKNIYKALPLIYLGDMISYYIAILNNVDPTSIEYIKFVKDAM